MILASIANDAVNPRVELRFAAKSRQPGKHFEEYVLRDFCGVGRIPGHKHRQPIDTALIPLKEKPLCLRILISAAFHQVGIFGRVLRTFPYSQDS
jgi:hypothetical protein